jgi:hypothetical protein
VDPLGQVALISISVFAKGRASPLMNLWKTRTLPGSSESFTPDTHVVAAAGPATPILNDTTNTMRSDFMFNAPYRASWTTAWATRVPAVGGRPLPPNRTRNAALHWPHSLVSRKSRVEAVVADADAVEADRDDLRTDTLSGIELLPSRLLPFELDDRELYPRLGRHRLRRS